MLFDYNCFRQEACGFKIGHISAAESLGKFKLINPEEKVSLYVIHDDAVNSKLETCHSHAQNNGACGPKCINCVAHSSSEIELIDQATSLQLPESSIQNEQSK